jgi:hypothetical protein
MKKESNYRKWSFKFLVYIILLNLLIAFMIVKEVNQTTLKIQLEGYETPQNNQDINLMILTILTNL